MKKKRKAESRGRKKHKVKSKRHGLGAQDAGKVEAQALAENRRLGVDDSWYQNAHLISPPSKERISIRLDEDVLEFFRSHGRGYQSRINAVLRAFVDAHKG